MLSYTALFTICNSTTFHMYLNLQYTITYWELCLCCTPWPMNVLRGNVGSFRCKFVCSSLLTWGPRLSRASQQWDINQNIFSRPCPVLSESQPLTFADWINFWSVLSGSNPYILEHGFMDSKISIYAKNVPIPVWKWDVKHLNHKVAIILLDWLVHFCQLVPKYEYMTHHKYAMNQPTLHLYYTWMIDHLKCCPNSFIVQHKMVQVQPSGLI